MDNLKVVALDSDGLVFDNGMRLFSDHDQDCCEDHYLNFSDVTLSDFDGLAFDLTTDEFFERVEGYGVALKPKNGHPVRIAGYASNNGYYSDNLSLVVTNPNTYSVFKKYDITECQS
jgi:hypothetical protein